MLKTAINRVLMEVDLHIDRYSSVRRMKEQLSRYGNDFRDISFLQALDNDQVVSALRNLDKSKSQFRQDLFVLSELQFKRNGFFVEFGATNGVDSSNTYLLEKEYGWTGILAEPAKAWHAALLQNRKANIELSCVWRATAETLNFVETDDLLLSTADRFVASDTHRLSRNKVRQRYTVDTISLEDLLDKYDAPKIIDYLSIDTEGSEFEILKPFNFEKYKFSVITCEHNFTPNREKVRALLNKKGYERRLECVSCVDDWFVRQE